MNATVNPDEVNDPYIYLDWNVFKYMKNNRSKYKELDEEFSKLIDKIKKRYRIPISPAHIKDRMSRFSETYIEDVREDFAFVDSVCEGYFIGNIPNKNDQLGLVKADIKNCYVDYMNEKENLENDESFASFISDCVINPNSVSSSHPMYYYLKDNQGNVKDFDTFLEKMYKDIFNETGTYANLRDYIRQFEIDKAEFHVLNLREICELDRLLYHITPFLLSFKYDSVEQLCNNWKYIANRFLSYNTSNPAMEKLLIHGYTLLDMHPLIKKEKLKKKKNTLDNIIRDGSHCYYASKANYFVSEDEAIRDKMSFLYSAYDIKTKILSEQELLYRFS